MKFNDIIKAVFIVLVFVLLYFFAKLTQGIEKLKLDWPKNRCIPSYMPFASYLGKDPIENFSYCVGNIQKDLMGYFLNPIQYILGNFGSIAKFVMDRIQFIRKFIDKLRDLIKTLVGDVYGMFVNILVQFQKFIIKLKDLLFKTTGLMVIFMYMVEGATMTGQSIWRGPIGDIMRFLCFSPNTPLILQNGKRVSMKNIHLGDILENGSEVWGKLKLKGDGQNPYYKIWSEKLKEYIYVTGSHKIFIGGNNQADKLPNYIEVKDHENAIKTSYYGEELCCLITSDHNIPIGEYTFWDWED